MPEATDPLTIGRRYAGVYAAFDTSELLDVLAPNLRFRQVNPGGYPELDSAAAYIDATRQFLDAYDMHCSAGATAEEVGDRILTTSRIQMHRGPKTNVSTDRTCRDAARLYSIFAPIEAR